MGNEAQCTARFGKQTSMGKALLETNELLFRGDFRLKIPFAAVKSVKAVDGDLCIEFPKGKATFSLGAQAEKWADKILHPKTRMEKLGIKAGSRVSAVGEFDEEFKRALSALANSTTNGKVAADSEVIFFAAESESHLAQSVKIAKSLKGAAALWIVYPKGRKHITENDVIASGRKAGLKDVKVVGFSPTHTALKFVLPVAKR